MSGHGDHRMTPARRAQVLRMMRTIRCPEELEGFRVGLREAGELADSEVMAALRDHQDLLKGGRLSRR
jgi:hypothetical protein